MKTIFSNSGLSDTIILDIISNYLVLPNRITVPLVSEVQIAQLRFPIPKVSTFLLILLVLHLVFSVLVTVRDFLREFLNAVIAVVDVIMNPVTYNN